MATSADRGRLLLFGGVIAGLLVLEAVLVVKPSVPNLRSAAAHFLADLSASPTAEFPGVGQRTVELPTETARKVRAAIKQHDYATADKIVADMSAKGEPDGDFIAGISDLYDPKFEDDIGEWVSHDPEAGMPLLVRAQFYMDEAWQRRGEESASEVSGEDFAAFGKYLQMAFADATAAIQHGAPGKNASYLKLQIAASNGPSEVALSTFQEAIAAHPDDLSLYHYMLERLEPKWGGSINAMYDFVDRYAGGAAQYSPLKLLYVDLYGDLLDSAWIACGGAQHDGASQCVSADMRAFERPELEREVISALRLYDHMDKYEFGIEIEPLITQMLGYCHCELYAGAVLELAASSMHSNSELQDTPGKNDYVVDKLVAYSWLKKKHYPNALQKAREALDDIKNTNFPSEAARDLAVAGVLNSIAMAEFGIGDIRASIAAERQQIEIGDVVSQNRYVCSESYDIKEYDDAIRACTQAIDDSANPIEARFWRGLAYQDSGNIDAAVKDWTIVATTENRYRPDATIDWELVLSHRGDDRGALDILSKADFLFDPKRSTPDWVAIAFNNRCYSRMQLGQFKEALDDCTESLKYGSIPDAYSKQLKLMKLLNEPGSAL